MWGSRDPVPGPRRSTDTRLVLAGRGDPQSAARRAGRIAPGVARPRPATQAPLPPCDVGPAVGREAPELVAGPHHGAAAGAGGAGRRAEGPAVDRAGAPDGPRLLSRRAVGHHALA